MAINTVYVLQGASIRVGDGDEINRCPPPVDEVVVYAKKEAALAAMRDRYSDALYDVDEDELYDVYSSEDESDDDDGTIVGESVIIYDSAGNEDRWTVFERTIKGA